MSQEEHSSSAESESSRQETPVETTEPTVEVLDAGELVYRVSSPAEMHYRDSGDGDSAAILEGRMMPYGEWTEVRSSVEGHFMERFSPGALAKTMSEQKSRIRVMFEHGFDRMLGRQAIADIQDFEDQPDGAYYRAGLLSGLPTLMVEGLRRGLYGSSIRFSPIPGKWDRVRSPRPSEHNPEGLPEHTIREARIKEFSVVLFPQYEGATAHIRSLTDEIAARQLLEDPTRLLEIIATSTTPTDEPQHSDREEPEVQAPDSSRSTQPVHDYLKPEEDDLSWLL